MTFPYTLRQPPGSGQRARPREVHLPERASIFLHDTPSQELFRADERTFSSGCIRVENPSRSPRSSSRARTTGNPPKIQQAVDSAKTRRTPRGRAPVLIVYWTVSVGASGELRYARDVNNLDGVVLRALNATGGRP